MVDRMYIDKYIQRLKISKKIASEAFTSSSTGIIEISRMIAQKPDYYVKPTPDIREFNQTIIFSDWTHYSYTPYQKELAETLLKRLLEEKFEVYVWGNHQFKRLEKVKGLIKSKHYIKPVAKDEIKVLAVKQLKKSINELHILDDQEMRRLVYLDNEILQFCIPLACLISPLKDTLINYLMQHPPKGIVISELIQTKFYNTTTTFNEMLHHLPLLESLPIYFKPLDINIRPNAPISHENVFLEALQIANLQYTDESIENIISAEIQIPTIDPSDLQILSAQFHHFIQTIPYLNQLKMSNLSFAIDLPDSIQHLNIKSTIPLTLNIQQIESLDFTSEGLQVDLIFNASPKLTKLHLTRSTYASSALSLLTELKELWLHHCDLTESVSTPLNKLEVLKLEPFNQTNSSLLQNCPNIKELSLNAETAFTYPECQLASLETCKLGHIYSEEIQKIIGHSPKLHTLILEDVILKEDEQTLDFEGSCLKTLELSLSSTTPQVVDYTSILKKCTNLEYLIISAQQLSIHEVLAFPNLKSLSIYQRNSHNTPIFHLKNVLTRTPNLESLSLSELTISDSFNYNLPSLKSLKISKVSTRYPLLKKLIQNPQKIKSIHLIEPQSEDLNYLINGDFPHLQELMLGTKIIELEGLKGFLKRHLEYQTLNYIILLNMPIKFQNDIELIKLLENIPNVYGMMPPHTSPQKQTSSNSKTTVTNSVSKLKFVRTNQMNAFDADTTPKPNLKFKIKQLFNALDGSATPLVNHYRLGTFGVLQFGNHAQPFKLSNHEQQWDDSRKPIQVKNITEYVPHNPQGYFQGKQTLQASSEWQALASLFPNETLSHFQVNPDIEIEIAYSERDNLYYVKCHKTVELNFLLHHPTIAHNQLPKEILDLIEHFNQFEAKALENPPADPEQLLKAILEQQVGACRHRAAAFKYLMDQLNIPSRIITNGCHAYVEVKYHDQWHRCELGGYPVKIDLIEMDIMSSQTTRPEKIIRDIPMEYVSEKELLYRQQFRPEPPAIVHSLNEFIFPLLNGEKPKQLIHAPVSTLQAHEFRT